MNLFDTPQYFIPPKTIFFLASRHKASRVFFSALQCLGEKSRPEESVGMTR